MVPGHSIWRGLRPENVDASWAKLFRSGYEPNEEPSLYIKHIDAGCELARKDQNSMLLYSGGVTDPGVPCHYSEGFSYACLADARGGLEGCRGRVAIEACSQDSYLNYLNSVIVFRLLTGKWPLNVIFVGFAFKEARFLEVHHPAVTARVGACWSVSYAWVNNPPISVLEGGALKGEEIAREQFAADPHGQGTLLHRKRQARDPYHRGNPLLWKLAA